MDTSRKMVMSDAIQTIAQAALENLSCKIFSSKHGTLLNAVALPLLVRKILLAHMTSGDTPTFDEIRVYGAGPGTNPYFVVGIKKGAWTDLCGELDPPSSLILKLAARDLRPWKYPIYAHPGFDMLFAIASVAFFLWIFFPIGIVALVVAAVSLAVGLGGNAALRIGYLEHARKVSCAILEHKGIIEPGSITDVEESLSPSTTAQASN